LQERQKFIYLKLIKKDGEIRKLSEEILLQLNYAAKVFSDFQESSKLTCPPGCGKCCFKPDVSCTPYELLPLALHLIENSMAEQILEKAYAHSHKRCVLLMVSNEENGLGQCLEYKFRPLICRVFGVAARKNKYGEPDLSICFVLKEIYPVAVDVRGSEIQFIEIWKKKLESLDPRLTEKEIPINQALIIILEKILLIKSFEKAPAN
jgi:Fe-S-cluster containining protein